MKLSQSPRSLLILASMITLISGCSDRIIPARAPAIAGLTQHDLALYRAVDSGNVKLIQAAVAQGANVNIRRRPWNMTPLLFAAEKHPDVARTLIRLGADVDAADRDGVTVLMKAVQAGNLEVVRLLLANSAKTEARDNFHETALIYAVVLGRTEIIRSLIDAGADVNVVRYDGKTLLVLAQNMVSGAKEMKFTKIMRHAGNHFDEDDAHQHPPYPPVPKNGVSSERIAAIAAHHADPVHVHGHEHEMLSKKQVIAERKQIVAILVASGAAAKEYEPKIPSKPHH